MWSYLELPCEVFGICDSFDAELFKKCQIWFLQQDFHGVKFRRVAYSEKSIFLGKNLLAILLEISDPSVLGTPRLEMYHRGG